MTFAHSHPLIESNVCRDIAVYMKDFTVQSLEYGAKKLNSAVYNIYRKTISIVIDKLKKLNICKIAKIEFSSKNDENNERKLAGWGPSRSTNLV